MLYRMTTEARTAWFLYPPIDGGGETPAFMLYRTTTEARREPPGFWHRPIGAKNENFGELERFIISVSEGNNGHQTSLKRWNNGNSVEMRHSEKKSKKWNTLLYSGTEGILSSSVQRTPSRAWHRGSLLGLGIEDLFSSSAQRASSRARHGGPPLGLGTEDLLSSSVQRASFRARNRGPPLELGKENLLSGSAQIVFSRAQHRGLWFGPESLISGSTQRASSRDRQRVPSDFSTEGLHSVTVENLLSGSAQTASLAQHLLTP